MSLAKRAQDPQRIARVLRAWELDGARFEFVPTGHINRTYLVEGRDARYVLQWLNPIFSPEVHYDIETITARLEAHGVCTPRLVRTLGGELWTTDEMGDTWRLFTHVPGRTLMAADSSRRCYRAGRLLGAFHRVLWDFEYRFRFGRLEVHDTKKHLANLQRVLDEHRTHRCYDEVEPLARAISRAGGRLDLDWKLPEHIVHGDPKISNVIFDQRGRAICLVDLDTLAYMPVAVELGDAFRSWCGSQGEEVEAQFDVEFFEASLTGYLDVVGSLPTRREIEAVPAMVEIVCVELSARFCADALDESYFGWDPSRFSSASEHNLVRARAQFGLSRSVHRQMARLHDVVTQHTSSLSVR